MYVDPITGQTYDYAIPITCDNNPQNIIELDSNSNDQDLYILRPEPKKENHYLCSHYLKLKLQYDPIHLQPKMLAQIVMQNLTRTE